MFSSSNDLEKRLLWRYEHTLNIFYIMHFLCILRVIKEEKINKYVKAKDAIVHLRKAASKKQKLWKLHKSKFYASAP